MRRWTVVAVAASPVALVAAGAGASRQEDRAFQSAACHVAFRYPANWVVHPDSAFYGEVCRLLVRPVAYDSLLVEADSMTTAYTVYVLIVAGDLEAALPTSRFERRDGEWVVLGRHGLERPATPIAGPGWRGVRGSATDGCHRIEGGYVGLCETEAAMVGTDTHTVMLEAHPDAEAAFERILATLEIRRPP